MGRWQAPNRSPVGICGAWRQGRAEISMGKRDHAQERELQREQMETALRRCDHTRPTHGGCTTWRATFGNGWQTGTASTTMRALRTTSLWRTRADRNSAHCACCAGARPASVRGTCVLPPASGMSQAIKATAVVLGVSGKKPPDPSITQLQSPLTARKQWLTIPNHPDPRQTSCYSHIGQREIRTLKKAPRTRRKVFCRDHPRSLKISTAAGSDTNARPTADFYEANPIPHPNRHFN
jgi:hypothetical protein